MRLAQRVQQLPPYLFARISELIATKRAAGVDVISLGIGVPAKHVGNSFAGSFGCKSTHCGEQPKVSCEDVRFSHVKRGAMLALKPVRLDCSRRSVLSDHSFSPSQ